MDQEAWAKSYEIKKPSLKEYSKYLKENNCYNQSTCPQPSSMYDKDGDIKLDKINSAALTAIFGTLIGTIYYTLSSERIQENDTILQPLVTSEEKEIPNIFSREFKYLTNPYLGAKFSLKVDRVSLKGKKVKKFFQLGPSCKGIFFITARIMEKLVQPDQMFTITDLGTF